jgi:uncharacterized membrane protein
MMRVKLINSGNEKESKDEEDEQDNLDFEVWNDVYSITGEVYLTCLLGDAEDITCEATSRDDKSKKMMEEEINVIEKNEIWELAELSKKT